MHAARFRPFRLFSASLLLAAIAVQFVITGVREAMAG